MKKKEDNSKKSKNKIEVNGKRIKFLSPDASIYKNDSTTVLFGSKGIKSREKPKSKFEEFISRTPILFENEEEPYAYQFTGIGNNR